MSDIFREVEEDLRRDQMTAAWKDYGPYIIAGAVLVVVVTAVIVGWRWWQDQRAQEYSDMFDAAQQMEAAQAKEALEELSADSNMGYEALASLNRAAILANDGQIDAAVHVYDDYAENSSDELWAGLASLQAARLRLDSASFEEMETRLTPLITPDGAWRSGAREILAFSALRTGDAQKARSLFEENIADSDTPSSGRSRAQTMLIALRPVTSGSEVSVPDANASSEEEPSN